MQENRDETLLYCFTGTGNSLFAAKQLGARLGDFRIEAMKKGDLHTPEKCKRIGFVFPTYFWGIPIQVEEFMKKLDLRYNKDTYFFALTTCGMKSGNALPMIDKLLREKGVRLNNSSKMEMVDNYILLYEPKSIPPVPKAEFDARLDIFAGEIIGFAQKQEPKEKALVKLIYKVASPRFKNSDRNFTVEGCNGCTICERVCPANNIVMQGNRPQFQHRCEQCLACLQYCPQKAINYKNKTQKRTRYHHPDVPIQERIDFYAGQKP